MRPHKLAGPDWGAVLSHSLHPQPVPAPTAQGCRIEAEAGAGREDRADHRKSYPISVLWLLLHL